MARALYPESLPAPPPLLSERSEILRWYEQHRDRLSGHGVWLLGDEPNAQPWTEFERAKLRVLVARLSTYRDVASSMSHALVGQIAREVPGVYVDYAYLPPPKDYTLIRDSGVPLWLGTTSKQGPVAFDVLAISNSISAELLNLPNLLLMSGVPLFKNERMARPDVPLVILGGANSSQTAILHGRWDGERGCLVDAVIVGEAEIAFKRFLKLVLTARAENWPKQDTLARCHGEVDGFYEPDRYVHIYQDNRLVRIETTTPQVALPVRRAVARNLDDVRTLEEGLLSYEASAVGVGSLQISEGCPCSCAFCQEGWSRKPYRERSARAVLESLRRAKRLQGFDTVNLYSFNFNMHGEIYALVTDALGLVQRVALKSQRADLLAEDPQMAEFQHRVQKASVTIGMEGISERLRRFLHKNLSEAQILAGLTALLRAGARWIKVFLVRTGSEENADLAEFRRFLRQVQELRQAAASGAKVQFSLTPLFIAPHTPLQFRACECPDARSDAIIRGIRQACGEQGFEFRLAVGERDPRLSQLLMLADRRLTRPLIRSSCVDGFAYYDSVPPEVVTRWEGYLADEGLSFASFFRSRDRDEVLPWDDISVGVSKGFLWDEFQSSLAMKEEGYCLGRGEPARCRNCGACVCGEERSALTGRRRAEPPDLARLRERLDEQKHPRLVRMVIDIEPGRSHVPRGWFGPAVARALMMADPSAVDSYLTHLEPGAIVLDAFHGAHLVDLAFWSDRPGPDASSIRRALAAINEQTRGFELTGVLGEAESPRPVFVQWEVRLPKAVSAEAVAAALAGAERHRKLALSLYRRGRQARLWRAEGRRAGSNSVLAAVLAAQHGEAVLRVMSRCDIGFGGFINGLNTDVRLGEVVPGILAYFAAVKGRETCDRCGERLVARGPLGATSPMPCCPACEAESWLAALAGGAPAS